MIAHNVVHTLDTQMHRKARKPGIYDLQILKARCERMQNMARTMKPSLMMFVYGGRKVHSVVQEHFDWYDAGCHANIQRHRLTYTEHGDFTACAGVGVCLR